MIARRALLVAFGKAAAIAALVVVSGCKGEPERGPVEIKFGRDTCDYCRMIISDPRFAAQIRGGPKHKAFKFDDIGDAVFFLDEQSWKSEPDVEFFVMDVEDGKTWLDARKAHFQVDMVSPMAYGFGAVVNARPGTITYDEMAAKVLEGGSHTRCSHDETSLAEGDQR